ncbi:hypothetical protein FRC07_007036 [Ceratobasidium sp. 392]|nr:hypothetical protein FRC07_007036 [Ceratobasidium sp. 392]
MAAVAFAPLPAHTPTPPPLMHHQDIEMDSRPPSPTSSTSTVTSSRTPDFFRQLHDRQMNCMNTTYMLPADDQEMHRMELEHRMMKFILGGKNYVGPVAEALTKVRGVQRRVLDCGTGNGLCTFLRELARVLRPGGVAIFAEVDTTPFTDKKHRIQPGSRGGAPGWTDYWDQVRQALGQLGIDVAIPSRLRTIVREMREFESIVAQEALVPIGFWPKDPVVLSIGQLAWMNYDNLLLALRPLLLDHGITPEKVATLIEEAQSDLYHPKGAKEGVTNTPTQLTNTQ